MLGALLNSYMLLCSVHLQEAQNWELLDRYEILLHQSLYLFIYFKICFENITHR